MADTLERLRQALLRLDAEDMKQATESEVFDMRAMEQITKHFEYLVERNAELRKAERDSVW